MQKINFGTRRKTHQRVTVEWLYEQCITNEKGCLLWQRALDGRGYGKIKIAGKFIQVHRHVFELTHGKLADGMQACHTCDIRNCINEKHLFEGTQADNMHDMISKGRAWDKKDERQVRGERQGGSKLKEFQVLEIRTIYKNKELNQYQLADKYGVSQFVIGQVVRNLSWKHVK